MTYDLRLQNLFMWWYLTGNYDRTPTTDEEIRQTVVRHR